MLVGCARISYQCCSTVHLVFGIEHLFGIGEHIEGAVFMVADVIGTVFKRHFHNVVFVSAGGKSNQPGFGEKVSHRAFGAEIATALAKSMAHFGDGAIAVIG